MKSVTRYAVSFYSHIHYFNPHTREECDSDTTGAYTNADYFNPHTREECDRVVKHRLTVREISIHTPVKSVTLHSKFSLIAWYISIHTPVKSVTTCSWYLRPKLDYFNPHTREECDPVCKVWQFVQAISIHTPVKSVTGRTKLLAT